LSKLSPFICWLVPLGCGTERITGEEKEKKVKSALEKDE